MPRPRGIVCPRTHDLPSGSRALEWYTSSARSRVQRIMSLSGYDLKHDAVLSCLVDTCEWRPSMWSVRHKLGLCTSWSARVYRQEQYHRGSTLSSHSPAVILA